jgi:hypothetical protein
MVQKPTVRETLEATRREQIIREIQRTVARELAALSEVPKTIPPRIADLLRELHRRLREPGGPRAD